MVLLLEDAHWADDATLDWLIDLDGGSGSARSS